MDSGNINSEIHKLIDGKIEAGAVVQVHWIAQEVLAKHASIQGDDADWYRVCTFKEVCRIAKSAIGKYKADDQTEQQLLFPGFKHLCRAYPIERDGDQVLVPVEQCTDAELSARADELEKMAKGCRDHAREIREFIMARAFGVDAPAAAAGGM
jgi:hypothetical protein